MNRSLLRARDGASGFTLIELMIVVAIVAILAAVAYPAYTNAVLKGKRTQGRTALLGLIQQEERYFTQNNSYLSFSYGGSQATDANSATVTPIPFQTTSGDNPSQAAYGLSAAPCTGTSLNACVVVTATPINGFSDPAVGALTIQSTGYKSCAVNTSTTAPPPSICWSDT